MMTLFFIGSAIATLVLVLISSPLPLVVLQAAMTGYFHWEAKRDFDRRQRRGP